MTESALRTSTFGFALPWGREAVGGSNLGPVQPQERIGVLDVVRGFALFGILQVNWGDFAGSLGNILQFSAEGKMRTIYSFLFGLGFAIQLIRAQEKGRPFLGRYLIRASLLFLIGAAHFVFIWRGDIIREYAIMSLTLLVVARWHPRVILVLAVVALGLEVVPNRMLPSTTPGTGTFLMRENPERVEQSAIALREDQELGFVATVKENHSAAGGSYWTGVRGGVALLARELQSLDIYRFVRGDLISLFLLGLYVGRRRIFHEPEKHVRLFRWVLAIGLPLGLVANVYNGFGEWATRQGLPRLSSVLPQIGDNIVYSVGNYLLSLAYIAGVTLLFLHRARVRSWFAATLAPVGRMGLTNYLMQSVIMMTLLYRGFGLAEDVGGWWRMLLLETVFVVQILYSRWWLKRFQFGPVEWAWRSLTWGRLQPMRIREQRELVAG